jgi:hypothetical protein
MIHGILLITWIDDPRTILLTWIDDPRNIVDYVDRRSTDYFVYVDDDPWNIVDYVDRRSTE